VVTFTATDAASNRATATTTVTVVPPPCEPLLLENFEDDGAGVDPPDWADYEWKSGRFRAKEAFRTAGYRDGIVYRSHGDDHASEYRTGAALGWQDYEWKGRFRLLDDETTIGLLFYADLAAQKFYEVELNADDHEARLRKGPAALAGADSVHLTLEEGVWYRFRIRVEGSSSTLRMAARVWADGRSEPKEWTLTATDGKNPLAAGTIAVFSSESGARFDDFEVKPLAGGGGSCN
jgi:hypothetical protein